MRTLALLIIFSLVGCGTDSSSDRTPDVVDLTPTVEENEENEDETILELGDFEITMATEFTDADAVDITVTHTEAENAISYDSWISTRKDCSNEANSPLKSGTYYACVVATDVQDNTLDAINHSFEFDVTYSLNYLSYNLNIGQTGPRPDTYTSDVLLGIAGKLTCTFATNMIAYLFQDGVIIENGNGTYTGAAFVGSNSLETYDCVFTAD